MTNAMIILTESVKLMEDGILTGTGEIIVVEDSEGNKKQLEMPEPIHTFAGWKKLGYCVKKNEHCIAKFPVWNYKSRKVKNEEGEEEDKANMFLKTAFFFKASQVERMKDGK